MRDVVAFILNAFNGFVLVYFIVLNTSYLVLIWLAATMTKHRVQRDDTAALEDILTSPLTPSISVIIPAWNEEAFIVDSAQAALRLRYPDHEVVIVDDGSTDSTFERLRTAFDLVEVTPIDDSDVPLRGAIRSVHVPASGDRLTVVRKENAGTRADAVNAGVNAASQQLVCFVDADSLLEADALLRTVQPFVDDPDRIVATGGVILALFGCEVIDVEVVDARQPTTWVARIQVIEYLRSFLLGRTGWSRLGALMIISGAFGLYRRDIVVELGGLDDESLGEDFDLLMGVHRHLMDRDVDYRVAYVPDPVCWTEVPNSVKVLRTQRKRWSHGLAQVLWKYRGMMFRPKYRRVGSVGMPYYVAFELLGPVIELVGLVVVIAGLSFGLINVPLALLFFSVAILYSILVSVASLVVEEINFHRYERWRDLGTGFVVAFIENLGFRQFHAFWRLEGLWAAVRRSDAGWGEMTRTGFQGVGDRGADEENDAAAKRVEVAT